MPAVLPIKVTRQQCIHRLETVSNNLKYRWRIPIEEWRGSIDISASEKRQTDESMSRPLKVA